MASNDTMAPVILIPGLYDSGPEHWQSHWERDFPDFMRLRQRDWETPHVDDWIETLDAAVASLSQPPVLVAHSLGCTLVGKWSERSSRPLKGALLVAPSDTEAPSYPPGTTGFIPMVHAPLAFRTIVVASTNDEYVTVDRATQFANEWGSELVWIGEAGHINSTSGLGRWEQGLALLDELRR